MWRSSGSAAQHSGLFLSEDEARYFFRVRS